MKKRMLSLAVLAASLFCFSNGANAQKTEKLFNGKDLSNWNFVVDKNSVPADQVYSVRDGKIFITGQPFGYMYTKEKYGDYKLHVEWRWPNGDSNANSGIFLHIVDLKNPFPNGIECNLQAGRAGLFVLLGGSDLVEYQQRPGEERPFFPVVKNVNPVQREARRRVERGEHLRERRRHHRLHQRRIPEHRNQPGEGRPYRATERG